MIFPELVRTQLAMHAATTAHRLAETRATLEGEAVPSVTGRRLRARRERLMAELEAWQYLVRVSSGNFLPESPEVDDA